LAPKPKPPIPNPHIEQYFKINILNILKK